MFQRALTPRVLLAYCILASTAIVFVLQLRTLYTVPVYDSIRWGGDETWLMREFGNQVQHGVMAYPESFGAPQRTDGVLAGSMWIDALIYGASGAAFFPDHDYVAIGRTVTAILAFLLILSLYLILRKIKVSPLLSSLSVAAVVLCQGFIWASHSARYDLLTGLSLIWLCFYLSKTEKPTIARAIAIGLMGVLAICFSRHLLFLGLAASCVFLWRVKAWKESRQLFGWVVGAFLGALLLSIAYYLGAGEYSLFGRGGNMGSYSFVIGQIPIMRPFSRNVQLSNLIERHSLFRADAPGLLLLITVALLAVIAYKIKQWQFSRNGRHLRIIISDQQRFFLSAAILCTFTWLLFEGSRPYYLFHIVPLLIIAIAIILQLWSDVFDGKWYGEWVAAGMLVVATIIGAQGAMPPSTFGEAVANDQSQAVHQLLKSATTSHSEKSRILFDVAGLARALQDTSRQVLTLDMFAPPPNAEALVNKLHSNHIDFVALRSSRVSSPFEPGRALIPHILDSIGEVQDSALGFFYDDGRTYTANLTMMIDQGLDTLRLYRVERAPFVP